LFGNMDHTNISSLNKGLYPATKVGENPFRS